MTDQALADEIITVRFTEPIEGIDPDDGETVLASRHRVLGVGLRQDRFDTLFLDAGGQIVGRWPTSLVERVDWSPKLSVTVAGGRGPSAGQERMRAIREKHPQAFKRWEPDEDERLTAEFQAGHTVPQLVELHGRARGGITARLIHLGLVDLAATTPRTDAPPPHPPTREPSGDGN
jgi:hypothetical protein